MPNLRNAEIYETDYALKIVMPVKKFHFQIVTHSIGLFFMFLGEIFVFMILLLNVLTEPMFLFLLIWLLPWTFGLITTLRHYLFLINGEEVIIIQDGILTLEKNGTFYSKPKKFIIEKIAGLKLKEERIDFLNFNRRIRSSWEIYIGSTMRFIYKYKTIEFGGSLDMQEAIFIFNKIIEKGHLQDFQIS